MAEKLIHEVLPVGALQCNCSILGDRSTKDAIVVDPGDESDRILEIVRKHGLRVRAIVSTHTHIDHVGGLATLHRATGAPVLIHEGDLELYRHLGVQAEWLGVPTPEMMRIDDFLEEGDSVRWGGYTARVLHTPGHTPGSISLLVEQDDMAKAGEPRSTPASAARALAPLRPQAQDRSILLAGDTLFQGSIGRTDLWGGSLPEILDSIREKLLTLHDDVVVYPGHGDTTTIGAEREENPFLR